MARDGDDNGDGGCYQEAFERLNPISQQDRATLEELETEIVTRMESTPEWSRLEEEWSRCVKGKGHEVRSSRDAMLYLDSLGGIQVLSLIYDRATGGPDAGTQRIVLNLEESLQVLELARSEMQVLDAVESCLDEQEQDRLALREKIEMEMLSENW